MVIVGHRQYREAAKQTNGLQNSTRFTLIGASTCIFAASVGLVQNDLKRVIAFSTCSQLGYMMLACGLSNYAGSIFHLVNHAFFKALLFLAAGSFIHALSEEQDLRRAGGLAALLPLTFMTMSIGSLVLVGFPFLSAFYSKDLVLEWSQSRFCFSSLFAQGCGTLSVLLTAYYAFRSVFITFSKQSRTSSVVINNCFETTAIIGFALTSLALASVFSGYFLKEMMVGIGSDFWGNSIQTLPHNVGADFEFFNQHTKNLPFYLSFIGIGLASMIAFFTQANTRLRFSYTFLNKRWFFDKAVNDFLCLSISNFGYRLSYKCIDKGFLEVIGPIGLTKSQTEPKDWSETLGSVSDLWSIGESVSLKSKFRCSYSYRTVFALA